MVTVVVTINSGNGGGDDKQCTDSARKVSLPYHPRKNPYGKVSFCDFLSKR